MFITGTYSPNELKISQLSTCGAPGYIVLHRKNPFNPFHYEPWVTEDKFGAQLIQHYASGRQEPLIIENDPEWTSYLQSEDVSGWHDDVAFNIQNIINKGYPNGRLDDPRPMNLGLGNPRLCSYSPLGCGAREAFTSYRIWTSGYFLINNAELTGKFNYRSEKLDNGTYRIYGPITYTIKDYADLNTSTDEGDKKVNDYYEALYRTENSGPYDLIITMDENIDFIYDPEIGKIIKGTGWPFNSNN